MSRQKRCVGWNNSVACAPPHEAAGGRVLKELPPDIDPESSYAFYLHGQIIEDRGIRPTHPEFGVYEYEAIVESLAAAGLVVISEARPAGTDGRAYARKVVDQVTSLLEAGVPPNRISVVGFSKGGGIAVEVSSVLENEHVTFVFLGTCPARVPNPPELQLQGRILSIHEASDSIAGPCELFFSNGTVGPEMEELELRLGGGHGAFYRPDPEWLDPVISWVTAPRRTS